MFESAVIGHLIGDYILQTDGIATRKKQSSIACAIHCAMWTWVVSMMGQVWHPGAWVWLFATHFAIDRTQFIRWFMLTNRQEVFLTKLHPWSAILVDNLWHVITIWVVYHYWEPGHGHAASSALILLLCLTYLGFVIDIMWYRYGRVQTKEAAAHPSVPENPVPGSAAGQPGFTEDSQSK